MGTLSITPWKWDERSTRNCIHAKVHKGLLIACAKGNPLGIGRAYAPLSSVLRGRPRRQCLTCTLFEHDVEANDQAV